MNQWLSQEYIYYIPTYIYIYLYILACRRIHIYWAFIVFQKLDIFCTITYHILCVECVHHCVGYHRRYRCIYKRKQTWFFIWYSLQICWTHKMYNDGKARGQKSLFKSIDRREVNYMWQRQLSTTINISLSIEQSCHSSAAPQTKNYI